MPARRRERCSPRRHGPGTPSIGGRVRPTGTLDRWNGRNGLGDWTLNVADLAPEETGEVVGWCLYVELFEDLLDLPFFEDDFESGDTTAWSTP